MGKAYSLFHSDFMYQFEEQKYIFFPQHALPVILTAEGHFLATSSTPRLLVMDSVMAVQTQGNNKRLQYTVKIKGEKRATKGE
ncbi:hypothetical protein CEXT_189401 [Caerostris extrusa]|uniref:Uncharacterized protein n=1 Tax=Caerostris extrusa TaxID=172846 RepID=A0AAV4SD57_CAEEX|nr:hypothetical protein CEXT_189401 [Caerostris extrusa]